MASVWIRERKTKGGEKRYRVEYRPGGRDEGVRFAGVQDEAARDDPGRVRRDRARRRQPPPAARPDRADRLPQLAEAADTWRATRVDVAEQTRKHAPLRPRARLQGRADAALEARRRARRSTTSPTLVAALAEAGYKRETIKKSRDALAMVLDHFRVEPNVVRDKRVKLPKERKPHVPPPLAEHVERIAETLPRRHVLPLLIIDECGPRVNELATAQVGDLDEHRQRDPRPLDGREERALPASRAPRRPVRRARSRRCRRARTATSTRRCSPT